MFLLADFEKLYVPLREAADGLGLALSRRVHLFLGMDPSRPARIDHLGHGSFHRLGGDPSQSLQPSSLVDGKILPNSAAGYCGSRESAKERPSKAIPAARRNESRFRL